MPWYDWFSNVYDLSVERLYVDARREAVAALGLSPGDRVLDVPCGTGQSFAGLHTAVGDAGFVIGADLSSGMLDKARRRAGGAGQWHGVGAADLSLDRIGGPVQGLHVFLGLSVFDGWEEAFEHLFGLLAPGGRCVVVDVHAPRPGLQGRLVQLTARADLTRRTWEPLERLSVGFERRELSSSWEHGGTLFLASGSRPS